MGSGGEFVGAGGGHDSLGVALLDELVDLLVVGDEVFGEVGDDDALVGVFDDHEGLSLFFRDKEVSDFFVIDF